MREPTLSATPLALSVLPGTFAICRLPPGTAVPSWAIDLTTEFCSVTRTSEELSIICPAGRVPHSVEADRGWHCLRLAGAFDLSEPGIVASVVAPLAAAGISVFVVATYDTDYLVVRDHVRATTALTDAGHRVIDAEGTWEG